MTICTVEGVQGPLAPVTGGCDDESQEFTNGRITLSDVSQGTGIIVDAAPYEAAELVVPIGHEARDYRLTIGSYLWAPLTIADAEWTGQYFNRTRRVQGG